MNVVNSPNGDPVAVDRFVESFAAQLTDAGMPRMASRVFVLLLTRQEGAATATELAERLRASAGAVSGAVRYLIQVKLVDREQLPGSRRDYYRVRPGVWYSAVLDQQPRYVRWHAQLGEGMDAVGPDTEAGRRLAETRDFFDYLATEMPALVERWQARHRP